MSARGAEKRLRRRLRAPNPNPNSSSDEEEPQHVPVRVPVHDPQAAKYSLDSMLEDVSSNVTICPAARVSLVLPCQDPFGW